MRSSALPSSENVPSIADWTLGSSLSKNETTESHVCESVAA